MDTGVHEKIQDIIRDIGRDLGFNGFQEVKLDNYRLDVTWNVLDAACPFAVFEISSICDFHKALGRLKDARINYGRPLLILIVEKEADVEKAERIADASFSELAGKLQIWTIEDVSRYSKIFKTYRKAIDEIFPEAPRYFFRRR